ncbi:MAG: OmpA family protein [Schleiferiaceae bacterium]
MRFNWFFIIIILTTPFESFSQNRKAQRAYFNGLKELTKSNADYSKAERFLQKAVRVYPEFSQALISLGDLSLKKSEISKAISYYERSALGGNPREGYFKMGMVALNHGFYQKAITAFSNYLNLQNIPSLKRVTANRYLKNSEFGIHSIERPLDISPRNINWNQRPENYPDSYFFPSISGDNSSLYFTGRNVSGGSIDENIYKIERLTEDSWTLPKMVPGEINTYQNEGAVSVQGDEKRMVFAACNRVNGFGSCDIFMSEYFNGSWSSAKNIGPKINTPQWETQPCLSSDGQYLFFVRDSRKPGSNSNIWMSRWNGSSWSMAKQLPGPINGSGDEFSPFLHADGKTLYFSSNSHVGMGGLDLFKSILTSNDTWSEPMNLGYPINDYRDNFGLVISTKGDCGFLAGGSLSKGSYQFNTQNPQIYQFRVPESLKPKPTDWVKIWALDKDDKTIIQNASWSLSAKGLGKESVGTGGIFESSIPIGAKMALDVVAKGYNMFSRNIFFDTSNGGSLQDTILLTPIKEGNAFVLNNIMFEFDKDILVKKSILEISRLVDWLNKNPGIKIEFRGHTDNKGLPSYNLELSKNRARSVYDEVLSRGISGHRLSFKGLVTPRLSPQTNLKLEELLTVELKF